MGEQVANALGAPRVQRVLLPLLAVIIGLGVACFGDDEEAAPESPTATGTSIATPATDIPDHGQPTAAAIIERMSGILGVSGDPIEVTAIESVAWADSCFEVARPGVVCSETETPGFRIVVEFFDDTAYELRGDAGLDRLIWHTPFEAEGEVEAIHEDLALMMIRGSGPPFDDALDPGVIQLALLPGTEFLTALDDLEVGERVRVGQAFRPASDVGALVWVASRSVAALDRWFDVVEAGDVAAIAESFQPQVLPCTLELGEGGPPKCWNFPEATQEAGTEVTAIEVYGCAISWVRADQLAAELEELAPRLLRYAAFEAGADYAPGGRFRDGAARAEIATVAVFDGAAAFGFDDEGVVAMWRGCGRGESPETFIPAGQTEFMLPPFPPLAANARPLGTGVAAIDAVIGEVESLDLVALEARIEFQSLACSTGIGAGGPPRCADGEAVGTVVEVFSFLGCEAEWHRASSVASVLSAAVEHRPRRYAAFEAEAGRLFEGPGTVLVFDGPDLRVGEPPWRRGMALQVVGDRIMGLVLACGAGAGGQSMVPDIAIDFLLDPPPRLAVEPSRGGCENSLTVTGQGFAPGARVALELQSSRDNVAVLGQASADQAGEVSFELARFPIGVDCDEDLTIFRASLLDEDGRLLPAYGVYVPEE